MLSKWHVSAVATLCLLSSCANESKLDLRAYYYPFDDLLQGKVYKYVPVGQDSMHPIYWYYVTEERDSGRYLTGKYFDEFFQLRQLTEEKWISKGILMKSCSILEPDSNMQFHNADLQIEFNAGFPFEVKDSNQVFIYKSSFVNPLDSLMLTTLIRNRRYNGSVQYEWKGKQLKSVEFLLNESIETRKDGVQELTLRGSEIYAQGLGLVEYRKRLNQQTEIHFRLSDIYSMSQVPKELKASISNAL